MADRPRAAARLSVFGMIATGVVASLVGGVTIPGQTSVSLRWLRRLALSVLAAGFLAGLGSTDVAAVQPGEILPDPALEARAREISKELRCLVCQNQSIDDSDAELAHDLRLLVRERVAAGDSNTEVVDYVVSRYGDFVLLRPPFKASTYALWIGPAAILGIGMVAVVVYYRRRGARRADPPALSDSERQRLATLMEDEAR